MLFWPRATVSRCDNETLCLWAEVKACQVGRLAAAVLACLEHWPSAIGILTGFVRVPVFRDSFIEHNSEIPVKLLSRANEGSSGGLQEEIDRQPYFHYWKGEPTASRLCSRLFQCSLSLFRNRLLC
jgi:hypothetical protein